LTKEVDTLLLLGINKVLLFGVVDSSHKDPLGRSSYEDDPLIARAVRVLKKTFPSILVFTDVCVCGYTDHGHCGLLSTTEPLHTVDNDATLPVLARMALAHARAGADYVSPSAMMDNQVSAIRELLDTEGLTSTKIMAYSAKYASGLYGPFRGAVNSAPSFGDRKTYQMDFRTREQGVAEARADVEEGADMLMVKPAHTYLDMISLIKQQFPMQPLSAYHVSGEYMMIKTGAKAGIFDEPAVMIEVLTAIKRAGADLIISYYAKEAVALLSKKSS
ncbi:MAG: porphobilinogen synthase, partial [Candidatus Margulisiibacteriota bacterium]